MDKARIQEMMVSDAITEKPISFTLSYQQEKEVNFKEKTIVKKLENRKFLFIHYSVNVDVEEEIDNIRTEIVDIKEEYEIDSPTLGKMQILSKYYLMLDIDENKLQETPHLEAMRICESKTDVVCSLMSAATFSNRKDLTDEIKIQERADLFKWNCKPKDFATVLLALLTQTEYANFMNSIRLAKLLRQNKPSKKAQANRVE